VLNSPHLDLLIDVGRASRRLDTVDAHRVGADPERAPKLLADGRRIWT
jgi:hypothetical protein